ncbi:MAG: YceI family protein [Polaribacter sp.]|nr:YceI family protein [Polaribacter sp.]
MKKLLFTVVLVALALVSFTSLQQNEGVLLSDSQSVLIADTVGNVDVSSSVIAWKGFKPTGSHNGTILLKEGFMQIKKGTLTGGTFVVDMTSIKDADGSKRLEGHLNSSDFFDVKKYPTSTFVITSIAEENGKLAVTGNLTLKEVTKSITIPASIIKVDGLITFKSETFQVNRADFNIKYKSKSFFANLKDKFIKDMMEISFEVKEAK